MFKLLHEHKAGTPTMGALTILASMVILIALSIIAWYFRDSIHNLTGIRINNSLWSREETYLSIFTLVSMGCVGFIDDLLNTLGKWATKGMSARVKMISLIIFGSVGALWFSLNLGHDSIGLPGGYELFLGIWYIPLFIFLIITYANAVNITDGLDGLAGGLLLFNYSVYAIITYHQGLNILSSLCLIIVGGLIAFLWFNIKPAKFYMGDVWSLALWANLAVMAMLTDTLIVLLIISAIYIWELTTSFTQLLSKRFLGRKIWKIAPYHHHLEAIGWSEETIVMRFWLIGMVLSVFGLIVYYTLGI
jgi:phospho-N-acetylmuramoyl-pentapeptide-transferase